MTQARMVLRKQSQQGRERTFSELYPTHTTGRPDGGPPALRPHCRGRAAPRSTSEDHRPPRRRRPGRLIRKHSPLLRVFCPIDGVLRLQTTTAERAASSAAPEEESPGEPRGGGGTRLGPRKAAQPLTLTAEQTVSGASLLGCKT